jgi:hypothetical protein
MYPYGSISVIQNEKAVPEERYLYVDLRILHVIQRRYCSMVYHYEKLPSDGQYLGTGAGNRTTGV